MLDSTTTVTKRKPCSRCGEEKRPGRGNRYCEECLLLEKKEAKGREKARHRAKTVGCMKCGGPKPEGQGRQFCDDCQELSAWAYEKRRTYHPPRPCRKCGNRVVKGRAYRYCEKCRSIPRKCQNCDNPSRAKDKKLCEVCFAKTKLQRREYSKQIQREYMADPEKRAKKREADKEYKIRLSKNKEWRERHNESQRMFNRLRKNSKPLKMETYLKGNGRAKFDPFVPTAPILPVIEQWLALNGYIVNGVLYSSESELRRTAKVSEKLIRFMRDGTRTTIRMADADRLCYAMGTTLDWVYGSTLTDGNRPTAEVSA